MICMPVAYVIWRLLRPLVLLLEEFLRLGGGSDRDGDGVPEYDWPDAPPTAEQLPGAEGASEDDLDEGDGYDPPLI